MPARDAHASISSTVSLACPLPSNMLRNSARKQAAKLLCMKHPLRNCDEIDVGGGPGTFSTSPEPWAPLDQQRCPCRSWLEMATTAYPRLRARLVMLTSSGRLVHLGHSADCGQKSTAPWLQPCATNSTPFVGAPADAQHNRCHDESALRRNAFGCAVAAKKN